MNDLFRKFLYVYQSFKYIINHGFKNILTVRTLIRRRYFSTDILLFFFSWEENGTYHNHFLAAFIVTLCSLIKFICSKPVPYRTINVYDETKSSIFITKICARYRGLIWKKNIRLLSPQTRLFVWKKFVQTLFDIELWLQFSGNWAPRLSITGLLNCYINHDLNFLILIIPTLH